MPALHIIARVFVFSALLGLHFSQLLPENYKQTQAFKTEAEAEIYQSLVKKRERLNLPVDVLRFVSYPSRASLTKPPAIDFAKLPCLMPAVHSAKLHCVLPECLA